MHPAAELQCTLTATRTRRVRHLTVPPIRYAAALLGLLWLSWLLATPAAVATTAAQAPRGDRPLAPPAHSALLSVVPADKAVLDRGPSEIVLTFNEDIAASFAQVALSAQPVGTAAAPAVVATSPVVVTGRVARVTLTPPGPGAYRIAYRVVSADGHPISGESTFRVQGATTPAPTSASSTSPTPGQPSTSAPTGAGGSTNTAAPGQSSATAVSTAAIGQETSAPALQSSTALLGGLALMVLAGLVGLWRWRKRS